eukprot:Gb_12385 [translate_table: standard]
MIQSDGSPLSQSSYSTVSPPLQSFSELSLASIRSAISSPQSTPQYPWLQELKSEERGLWLIQLLLTCANHVSNGNMEHTNMCLEQISLLASLTGDPMQRVATYFMEGLAARITKSWPGLYKALNSTQLPSIADLISARQVFFNLCPYLKFAFTVVNQAIMDAMEGEKVVHIIDLDASEPIQWVALLQALCSRPGGPPHLKITGINEKKEVLDQTAQRLSEEAEALYIPFQFHPIVTKLENLDVEMLKVKTGEAVAISAVLQLHGLLAEEERLPARVNHAARAVQRRSGSPHDENHRSNFLQGEAVERLLRRNSIYNSQTAVAGNGADRTLAELFDNEKTETSRPMFLPSQIEAAINNRRPSASPSESIGSEKIDRFHQMLRSLSPKVMVVVEQESNHNGTLLMERFVEALHFYGAMFDSLESTIPQQCVERVTLEKHLFGQQIKNIVACEGLERVERHEKLEKWMNRLDRAGFALLPLSYTAAMLAKRLLHSYSCEAYRLVEDRGCLTLCWQERPLFSVSAWQS